jgi:hypothetical protein
MDSILNNQWLGNSQAEDVQEQRTMASGLETSALTMPPGEISRSKNDSGGVKLARYCGLGAKWK